MEEEVVEGEEDEDEDEGGNWRDVGVARQRGEGL